MENKMTKKNLAVPDELRTFPKRRLELAKAGGVVLGKATLLPGWKWSESLKLIVGTQSRMPGTPAPRLRQASRGDG
jgi:hypothetical protein